MNVSLYEHSVWQQTPQRLMRPGGLEVTKRALDYCDLQPGARLLDLGCGLGESLHRIHAGREWRSFGIDISAALLRQAHHNCPKTIFAQARGEWLPFAYESLDAIIAECTLSIMETELVLRECARTLKCGGYLMINDVYARNEEGMEALQKLPTGTCIGSAMSQRQILERLIRCGFRLVWWQDCSEKLKEFSICALTTAAGVDPFDLYIAAARARLGYYFLVARKEGSE